MNNLRQQMGSTSHLAPHVSIYLYYIYQMSEKDHSSLLSKDITNLGLDGAVTSRMRGVTGQ